MAQRGQRLSKERLASPRTSWEEKVDEKKRKKEKKAAGWKRRQREGNQTRRGTKRDGPPRRVVGRVQGWTPEGWRATASPEKRQGCLAARCSLMKAVAGVPWGDR